MIVHSVTSICTTEKSEKSVLKETLIYDSDLQRCVWYHTLSWQPRIDQKEESQGWDFEELEILSYLALHEGPSTDGPEVWNPSNPAIQL